MNHEKMATWNGIDDDSFSKFNPCDQMWWDQYGWDPGDFDINECCLGPLPYFGMHGHVTTKNDCIFRDLLPKQEQLGLKEGGLFWSGI